MMIETPTALMSLDDLLKMGDARVEIIEGRLVGMNAAGFIHHIVAGNIYRPVDSHVIQFSLGAVFFDGLTYLMFSDAKGLKDSFVPDVSFIRLANMMAPIDLTKPYPGVPDLAVEVISPGDDADEAQAKLRTYLAKGTEQVWIVYPTTKELHQYRRDNNPEIRIYRGSQSLDLTDLFPGLELTTDQIFSLPAWALR
jgi:Uma2 family endonuclease